MKRWNITAPPNEAVSALTKGGALSELCASVLAARGISSLGTVQELLGTDALSDPMLLRDMPEAVDCINSAIDNGTRICVYGDYDCDGVTATVMLFDYLTCLGADVTYYIPERAEGYGLNEPAIRAIAADGVSLIITVDNGISAIEEAKLIASLGMTLVVTDHHQPGDILPEAAAVVNPHRRDCPSPYKPLCGAGVVLKLIAALDGGDCDMALEQFGDLALLGTIADIVPLTGENRYIAERGLTYIQNTERPGLLALIAASGAADKTIDAHTVGFVLAPRINAAGRFGSPKQAAELLLCQDPDEAVTLAQELNALNQARKDCEAKIEKQILTTLSEQPELLDQRVLILWDESWHAGVLGILAARMLERFGKPCILLTVEGDSAKGSMRSFGDFSSYQCLDFCKDLLTHWGGHKGAGGLSLPTELLPELRRRAEKYAAQEFAQMPVLTTEALAIPPRLLSVEQVASLDMLAPFGEQNPEPLFALRGVTLTNITPCKSPAHTRLTFLYENKPVNAIWFFKSADQIPCCAGTVCDVLVRLSVSSYLGKPVLSVHCAQLRAAAFGVCINKAKNLTLEDSYFAARASYEAYRRKEALSPAYYERMIPTRDELVAVYKHIPETDTQIDTLFVRLVRSGINYCKLRLCLDIFAERGLTDCSPAHETVRRVKVEQKVDIFASPVYLALTAHTQKGGITV